MNRLQHTLDNLLHLLEIHWKQRACTYWIKENDKNTRSFHSKATMGFDRNTIKALQDNNGRWVTKDQDLRHILTQYFKDSFSL